jgi:outer membrane protein OmpA-like peptidoglycan-associated protein
MAPLRVIAATAAAVTAVAATASPAAAEPHSGVDAALFRPSLDAVGVFSVEGARLMPKRDLSWKMLLGYAQKPFDVPIPGIGEADDDAAVLDFLATVDLAFALAVTGKLTIGFNAAVYRTDTGEGYGRRGRFFNDGSEPSTGLISLRPLSNIDQSGGFEPQGLSGPLDVRVGAKYMIKADARLAVTLMGAAAVPFGEDEMFLGDRGFVLEPRVLVDYRFDQVHATKLVLNLGARIRERTVLEAFDPMTGQTENDATVVADIGSEILAGVGVLYELGPRIVAGAEAVGFVPLPGAVALGSCRRHDLTPCSRIDDDDYYGDGGPGDLAAYAIAGVGYRASPHVMVNLMGGLGLVGMRRDDARVVFGVTWSPQPRGVAAIGRGDRDGDGIPDISDSCIDDPEDRDGYQDDDGCPDVDNDGDGVLDANDACPNEPEDRDGFQDEDGCPERDNDGDGITDVADRCPDSPEDLDGFEDDDGCPDDDNDGDGFPDDVDQCPNDAETVNGIDDDDGCPDVRVDTGPEEGADRINLKGATIRFQGASATLTNASKQILDQVARLIRDRGLRIRVEVHVPLGTRSANKAQVRKQKQKDKTLTDRRAQAVLDYLVAQNVPIADVQAVGLGSDRPLGSNVATDPANERVDFIKAQQRNP